MLWIRPSNGNSREFEHIQGEEFLAESGDKGRKESSPIAGYHTAARIRDSVIQMVVSSILGALAGNWLDKRLGVKPWCLVVGSLLGIGAGMIAFLRAALATSKRPEKR